MNSHDQKPGLHDTNKKEGRASSFSHSKFGDEGRRDKNRKKKRFSLFQKIAMGVVAIIVIVGGLLVYKFAVLGNKIIDSDSSLFDQIRLLVNSDDEKLKGEEEGRINILLLGKGGEDHPGSNLTDTIMLLSINTKTNQIGMMSIPRDLYVPLPGGGKNKINSVHAFAEQDKEGSGPEAISGVIKQITGQDVHYYVRVDFEGFQKVVDDLGGIDVPIEEEFYDYLHKVRYREGIDHMDGLRALIFARGRYIEPSRLGGDFHRAEKQQKVILAVRDKFLSSGAVVNPDTINKLLNDLGNHVRTSMEIWEMRRAFDLVKDIPRDSIVNRVVDEENTKLVRGDSVPLGGVAASILVPTAGNFSGIQDLAANIFDANYLPEDASVEVQNGTATAGLATTAADSIDLDVIKIANATKKDYASTVIYDYSAGKVPSALKKMEELFGVSATSLPDTSVRQSAADIVIIVGADYASKE